MSLPVGKWRWCRVQLAGPRRAPARWTSVGLVVLGLVVYRAALDAGFTHWDDDLYLTRNPEVHELSPSSVAHLFTSFSNCNYHPLTYLTWMVEYHLVGPSPWLYHLDNVLLHVATSILCFVLSRRLLDSTAAGALVAGLFLVHPLRVESVAWVSERKDVLCALFYLAGLAAWLRVVDEGFSRRTYALTFGLHLAALLSKVMAVTFPAVQLLFLAYRRRLDRRNLAAVGPFVASSLVFAVLGYLAQKEFGAVKGLHGGTATSHLLSVPQALAIYAGKLVIPYPLSPRYLITAPETLFDPLVVAGLALMLCGAVTAYASYRRSRVVFLGLGFFALTWAPVSGVVPTSTVVADRYMYLPALGLLWPLCDVAVGALRRSLPEGPRFRAAAGFALLLALGITWAVMAERRVHVWKDGVTLWTDALRENPQNPHAHNQLAVEYLDAGDYGRAAASAIESIRRGLRRPKFLFNLCLAYRGLGDAARERESARGILSGAPDFLPAWMVELRHLRKDGKLEECSRRIEGLLARFPGDPTLLAARADLHLELGELDEALADYLNVLEERPGDCEALLGAGLVVARLGDGRRSLRLGRRALELHGRVFAPWERERLEELRQTLERQFPALAEELTAPLETMERER